MALPLIGLWLLVAQPRLDGLWEHHLSHFWLVVGVAAINVLLGVRMNLEARRPADARLVLVSLTFLSSAGFLLLHALATPGVILSGTNAGFVLATPAGLLIAAVFAAFSSLALDGGGAAWVIRRQHLLTWGLAGVMVAWGFLSLAEVAPLNAPLQSDAARGSLVGMAAAALALYGIAGARYLNLYRRRPAVVLLSVTTAFVLLAEAMIAVAYSRPWRASWWEWHLLMLIAFGFVAYSAHVQNRREGGSIPIFNSIALEQTVSGIRAQYEAALESFVEAIRAREKDGDDAALGPAAFHLSERFRLTEGQGAVLERAANALAAERQQIARLGALVQMGREARVILAEDDLLRRAVEVTGEAFPRDVISVGLLREGSLSFPEGLRSGGGADDGPGEPSTEAVGEVFRTLEPVEVQGPGDLSLVLPLTVKGNSAGVLMVRRRGGELGERDRSVLQSLASQLSIALENARLYREIDRLFRSYMSPAVATALLADPDQASLGGAVVEITVLFADLQGFTSFSEATSPERVVTMLNEYFGAVVPLVLAQGGTVVQFVGDAIMAVFNAPVRQPDHALRAARAALAVRDEIEGIAGRNPGWPSFRIGINTGPALVGNIGSAEMRNFTAIGDTTNLAARLQTAAAPGRVVIGATTYSLIRDRAEVRPLAPLSVKGKQAPVEAYELVLLTG